MVQVPKDAQTLIKNPVFDLLNEKKSQINMQVFIQSRKKCRMKSRIVNKHADFETK